MAAGMPPLSLFRLRTSDSRLVRVPISATSVPDTSRRIILLADAPAWEILGAPANARPERSKATTTPLTHET
jgi:hypothetical protein